MLKKSFTLCIFVLLLTMIFTACSSKRTDVTTAGETKDTSGSEITLSDGTPTTAHPVTDAPSTTVSVTTGKDAPLAFAVIGKDSDSDCAIIYTNDEFAVPAYTLREALDRTVGASLNINGKANKSILLSSENSATLGNYGYNISLKDNTLTISAPSLAGFDMAITRLVSDCYDDDLIKIPLDYSASEALNWNSDYVLEGEDFKEEYLDDYFYNDKNDSVAYVLNAMWHMFGLIDDGQSLVYRFGNEPTWYEWMSEKIMWSSDKNYVRDLKNKIISFPQTSTGYMWSWGAYPYWKVDDTYSIHYDGTFRYIASVYDVISWEGNTDFLYEIDQSTAAGDYSSLDSSKGKSVLEKTEACMNYILEYLHGKEGHILLTEESTYLNKDGSLRFDLVLDTGDYCWNNTGKDGSAASNYWDNLCFGGYDGYSNALFYNSLLSMAGIYRMLGDEYSERAEELESLAVTVKEKFGEMYWSDEKGRYIACIDSDGRRVDFGLTFHNYEIMKYGLADEERAKSIFDWIDGDRIIRGENRSGKGIFSYSKILTYVNRVVAETVNELGLKIAAVTNTISINNKVNEKTGVAWWHGPDGINVWGSAAYGKHLENGGYIFYTVFYELMARTVYEGAQSTTDRLVDIARVYEYNRLKSDLAASGSTTWLEGLNGEYPENGLVPTAYLYGLMGVRAEYDGIHLSPSFNDVYEYMGVKKLSYRSNSYDIRVYRDASVIITPENGLVDIPLHYSPERFKSLSFLLTIVKNDGTEESLTLTPDDYGVISVNLSDSDIEKIIITPKF